MIAFVIDASALVELLIGATPAAGLVRRARTGACAAPELIEVEALHVLRRIARVSDNPTLIDEAARDVQDTSISRVAHRPLLGRIWELRDSLTAYDAAYVALAEQLRVPLLTCDARLGRAHGHDAEVIVYPRS